MNPYYKPIPTKHNNHETKQNALATIRKRMIAKFPHLNTIQIEQRTQHAYNNRQDYRGG